MTTLVPSFAQDNLSDSDDTPFRVATYECPPFVYRDDAGDWTGLAIQFWEETAAIVNRPYTYEERPLPDILRSAEAGEIDIGISCISITPEREERIDFSHAVYQTHLSIAVKDTSIWGAIFNLLIDPGDPSVGSDRCLGRCVGRWGLLSVRTSDQFQALFPRNTSTALG